MPLQRSEQITRAGVAAMFHSYEQGRCLSGEYIVGVIMQNGLQVPHGLGVTAAGKAVDRLVAHVLILVLKTGDQYFPDFRSVYVALLCKAERGPVSHFGIPIARKSDKSFDRRLVIHSAESDSYSVSNVVVRVVAKSEDVRCGTLQIDVLQSKDCRK